MSAARPAPLFVHRRRPAGGRRGFSLLEILLAVALATMLLLAVNFFVLSMGELWGGGSESRLFDRHVRGVTRFLEALVEQSVLPTQEAAKPTSIEPPQTRLPGAAVPRARALALVFGDATRRPAALGAANGVRFGLALGVLAAQTLPPPDRGGVGRLPNDVRRSGPNQPPGGGVTRVPGGNNAGTAATDNTATGPRFRFGTPAGYDGSPPMLIFEIDEAPGQCVWPQRPLPQVECALQVNADEGLVLLWKSKLEEDFGKGRPRKTQLSPFARAISFDYYDADRKTWTHAEQPQADGNGGWLVPQRVRITFVYQNLEREVSITLPEAPGGPPLR